MVTSFTWKSRTLKAGESIAHCRAHPLAMHSSKFSVLEHSLPKNSEMVFCTAGTRDEPPTISTVSMSSLVTPQPAKASSTICCSLPIRGAHSSRKMSRSIMPLTSMSSMKHSMEMGACGLDESTFFVFSAAVISRNHAFLLVCASMPCFSFHSAAKWSAITRVKSSPPRWRSVATERTVSLPLTKATIATVVSIAPQSTNATLVVLSGGRSVL
mmetsp:Transcript_5158/g.17080  ORF Transcript_5158/g.17080 Transcript_5158/m.17080 type:complete len:213 (+) Transcript_5158:2011-2649(+)